MNPIAMDEAHLKLIWADFCPSLRWMGHTLEEILHTIPRVLFSSTILPRDTKAVAHDHYLHAAVVNQTATVRKII